MCVPHPLLLTSPRNHACTHARVRMHACTCKHTRTPTSTHTSLTHTNGHPCWHAHTPRLSLTLACLYPHVHTPLLHTCTCSHTQSVECSARCLRLRADASTLRLLMKGDAAATVEALPAPQQQTLVALCASFACRGTANASGDEGTDAIGSKLGPAPCTAVDSPMAGALGRCKAPVDVASSVTCPAAIVCVGCNISLDARRIRDTIAPLTCWVARLPSYTFRTCTSARARAPTPT